MPSASAPAFSLLVEGWRWILHSYSVVNLYHLLELSRRPEIAVFHKDVPYIGATWRPLEGLFPPEDEATINRVGPPPEGMRFDACLRMGFPYDFSPAAAGRLLVFMTSDSGWMPPHYIRGNTPLRQAQDATGAILLTPSNWSRAGLIRQGADPERVVVVPHGADLRWLKPLGAEERRELRRVLGWEDRFVILNIGAMSGNKGVHFIAKAVAALLPRHPNLLLYLKGSDHTYKSEQSLNDCFKVLTGEERARLQDHIQYNGKALTYQQMALLYQAADLYVAPYSAEGFNMPVLESMACGLPVVCTAGGPTDDFLHPDAALTIASRPHQVETGTILLIQHDHLVTQMTRAIEDTAWRQQAQAAGPGWVAEHYSWARAVDRLMAAVNP